MPIGHLEQHLVQGRVQVHDVGVEHAGVADQQLVAEATTKAVKVVVMTAYGSPQLQERLYEGEIFAYLEKPVRLETLLSFVEKAVVECAS